MSLSGNNLDCDNTHLESKKKSGCLQGCLMGCGALFALGIIVILSGYYALVYSSAPLQCIAKLISKSPDAEISGVEGSLSSGFEIEKIRIKDAQGNVNKLDGLEFKYDYYDTTVELSQLSLLSAHLFVRDENTIFGGDSSTSVQTNISGNNNSFETLFLKNVDIRNLTIENYQHNVLAKLDFFSIDSLILGDNIFSLKEFLVKSSDCNISIESPAKLDDGSLQYSCNATFAKDLFDVSVKDIVFTGSIKTTDAKNKIISAHLSGFDKAFYVESANDHNKIKITNFTPTEYFSGIFCFSDINIDLSGPSGESIDQVNAATFKIGSRVFNIDTSVFYETNISSLIQAESLGTDISFYCSIDKSEQNSFSPTITLSSDPVMGLPDILSNLLFTQKYSNLTNTEQGQVMEQLSYCTLKEDN